MRCNTTRAVPTNATALSGNPACHNATLGHGECLAESATAKHKHDSNNRVRSSSIPPQREIPARHASTTQPAHSLPPSNVALFSTLRCICFTYIKLLLHISTCKAAYRFPRELQAIPFRQTKFRDPFAFLSKNAHQHIMRPWKLSSPTFRACADVEWPSRCNFHSFFRSLISCTSLFAAMAINVSRCALKFAISEHAHNQLIM